MKLRLLFTDSVPQSCPTVYETDRGTFVIQGDRLTDPEARADLANLLPGEDAVETPRETLLGAVRVASGASRMLAADSEEFLQLFETFEHTAFRFETLDRYAVPEEDEALRRSLLASHRTRACSHRGSRSSRRRPLPGRPSSASTWSPSRSPTTCGTSSPTTSTAPPPARTSTYSLVGEPKGSTCPTATTGCLIPARRRSCASTMMGTSTASS
jgi:hypothetical protein